MNSGRSVFLYGPPGNGKTTIGEAIGRLMSGDVYVPYAYVPYAIDVDGHVIKVYDPLIHHQSADPGGRHPVGNVRTGAGSAATGSWWWLAAS